MKKVLFLAVAALAYVGAANAQTIADYGTAYPTANVITTTSLATVAGGQVNGLPATPIKMTATAAYDFQAASTDWTNATTALGADWSSYIKGSKLYFNNTLPGITDATFALLSAGTGVVVASPSSVTSNLITTGTSSTFGVSITATSALTKFDFFETAYDLTSTAVGCGTPYTINVNTVVVPTWSTTVTASTVGGDANVKINNTAFCLTDATAPTSGAAVISILVKGNDEINTRYFNTTLEKTSGTVSTIYSNEVLSAAALKSLPTATETYTLDLFPLVTTTLAKTFIPGVYKFSVTGLADDILCNAESASVTAIANTNIDDDFATFTVLPTPKPTLTTATKN